MTSKTFEEDFQLPALSAVHPSRSLKNYKCHSQLPVQKLVRTALPSKGKHQVLPMASIQCFPTHTISGTFCLPSILPPCTNSCVDSLSSFKLSSHTFSRWEWPLICVPIWHPLLISLDTSQDWHSRLRNECFLYVTSMTMRSMKTGTLSALAQLCFRALPRTGLEHHLEQNREFSSILLISKATIGRGKSELNPDILSPTPQLRKK